jgi:arylsulfatase A-like enzyme
LTDHLPETRHEWKELLSARSLDELALPLLERHVQEEKLFVWLHYMDPHGPYYLIEWDRENRFIGDEHDTGEEKVGNWFPRRSWIGDHDEIRYYVAQHDANVLVTDTFIESMMNRAGELGLLDDALGVFTADHGEALGQHNYMGHGRVPYNTGVHVPLIFHRPSDVRSGIRIDRPVERIDLYPTLADLLGWEMIDESFEGGSLASFLRGGPKPPASDFRFAFSGTGNGKGRWYHFRMVQDERWKLIRHSARGRAYPEAHYELYDVESDPGETVDLYEQNATEATGLRTPLERWMEARAEVALGTEGEGQGERTRKILKALGYVQ